MSTMAADMFISNSTTLVNSSLSGLVSNVPNLCTATAPSNSSAETTASDLTEVRPYVRGGVDYLQLGVYVLIDVVGLVGNSFVLGVVALCKDMRTVANYFIVSLSVADLLVCLVVVPIITTTRWIRKWSLGKTTCDFVAIINITCMAASLFSLAAIAVNRVVITRRPGKYPKLFSKPLSMIYIAITWFFSLLYALMPALGWGETVFDEIRFVCLFSRDAAPSYSIFFGTCCVMISQVICGICYLMILITFRRSQETLTQNPGVRVSSSSSLSEKKLTINLIVVWLAFLLGWSPTMALLIVDSKGDLGEDVYAISAWMMFANSCVNPILYGVFNKKFRSGYIQLINKASLSQKCQNIRVGPTMQQSGSSRPFEIEPTPGSSRGPLESGIDRLAVPKKVLVRGRFIEFE